MVLRYVWPVMVFFLLLAAAVTSLTTEGGIREKSFLKNPASWVSSVDLSMRRKLPSSTP
jgi:hypothetical protein